MSEAADQSDNFAEDDHFVDNDVLHGLVFRMKNKMFVFAEKSFDGRAVIKKGDNDVSVICGLLLTNDDFIAVVNSGIDHTGALDV